MARMKAEVQKLEAEKARLKGEIEALERRADRLRGEMIGIERAIALVGGSPSPGAEDPVKRERARNVKETVLTAVQAAGPQGINVNQLLERTEREGVHLERGTVSSLLSRFKREGILAMTDGRYFVPTAEMQEAARRTIFN